MSPGFQHAPANWAGPQNNIWQSVQAQPGFIGLPVNSHGQTGLNGQFANHQGQGQAGFIGLPVNSQGQRQPGQFINSQGQGGFIGQPLKSQGQAGTNRRPQTASTTSLSNPKSKNKNLDVEGDDTRG